MEANGTYLGYAKYGKETQNCTPQHRHEELFFVQNMFSRGSISLITLWQILAHPQEAINRKSVPFLHIHTECFFFCAPTPLWSNFQATRFQQPSSEVLSWCKKHKPVRQKRGVVKRLRNRSLQLSGLLREIGEINWTDKAGRQPFVLYLMNTQFTHDLHKSPGKWHRAPGVAVSISLIVWHRRGENILAASQNSHNQHPTWEISHMKSSWHYLYLAYFQLHLALLSISSVAI